MYCVFVFVFVFFKQKTAYEMRISDWSSDVCSFDPPERRRLVGIDIGIAPDHVRCKAARCLIVGQIVRQHADGREAVGELEADHRIAQLPLADLLDIVLRPVRAASGATEAGHAAAADRSEEHTSELQSLMRIAY